MARFRANVSCIVEGAYRKAGEVFEANLTTVPKHVSIISGKAESPVPETDGPLPETITVPVIGQESFNASPESKPNSPPALPTSLAGLYPPDIGPDTNNYVGPNLTELTAFGTVNSLDKKGGKK